MPRPPRRPEPYATGSFAVAAARADGVAASSLRSLGRPFRGVRAHEVAAGLADQVAALGLVRAMPMAASHCTAARLHALPLPRGCEHDTLHIMTAASGRVRRPGVIGHRGLEQRTSPVVGGVPVTDLADTWLDLAPHLSLDALVVLGDAVARWLGDVDEMLRRLDRTLPGVTRAREALGWVRTGSASPMETRSRVLVARAGLPEPRLNSPITDASGGWLASGDLVWDVQRVVGEYQGADHFGDYSRGDRDITRRRAVEGEGWTYVDFTKDDYWRQPRRVALVQRLADALGVELAPDRMAEVATHPGLPGSPLRRCGG